MERSAIDVTGRDAFVSACSGGGTAQNGTNPEGTPNSGTTTETAGTETEGETEEVAANVPDLGGRVIKVAAWWDLTPAGRQHRIRPVSIRLLKSKKI